MITSPSRNDDLLLYEEILAIIEICIGIYKKTQDEAILAQIQALYRWAEEVKDKIDTKDYTEADKFYYRHLSTVAYRYA
jgi:alpha/beta superfamily hydrolase